MKKQMYIQCISFVLLVAMWIYFFPNLPAKLPAHWGINGNVDHLASKTQVMFALLGTYLLLTIFFVVIPLIDPKKRNYISLKNYTKIQYIVLLFYWAINALTIYFGLHRMSSSPQIIFLIVGLLFVFLGNYSLSLKQNFFIGIKTPWTLSNEKVWDKTNRLGAKLLIAIGFIIGLGGFLPGVAPAVIMVIGIIFMIIFPMVYSYLIYQKIDHW